MRVIHLALKDLRQIVRDPKSLLFLLALPVIFTWLMGVIFDTNREHDPRLPIGFVNLDDNGELGAHLNSLLAASETIRPVRVEADQMTELQKQVGDQSLAAVVIVPRGFSEQTATGAQPQLIVVIDRNQPIGQAADRAIQLTATRLLGAVQVARLSADRYGAFDDQAARRTYEEEALALAIQAWQQPRVMINTEQTGLVSEARTVTPFSGFVQSSAGMMVFFASAGMITAGYVLLAERRSRTLMRLLTTSLTRAEVIAGHTLAMFTIGFGQLLLLTLFGQFALGVNYWHAPLALLLMIGVLSLWAASCGLLISTVARNESQVVLLALGSMLVLGLMGGAIFPLELTGKSFAAFGRMLPIAWAIEGLQHISLRGLGLSAVLLPAGMLLAYTALIFGLAVWRFRFDEGL